MAVPFWAWPAFFIFIFFLLILDLVVLKERRPWLMTIFWIALALIFNFGVAFWLGLEKGLEFFTAYIIEKSLSVDNLFVFILIFAYFGVSAKEQHRILFWGILGAMAMRLAFILGGLALIGTFHWLIYVFGAFLVWVGIKFWFSNEQEMSPEKNWILRLIGGRFSKFITVLLAVESMDIVFAVDSVPAVLAISDDAFIVFTSNVFAILGLRALYSVVAGGLNRFHYLKFGLSAVLVFIGLKMLTSAFLKVPILISLAVIAIFLTASIIASLLCSCAKKP